MLGRRRRRRRGGGGGGEEGGGGERRRRGGGGGGICGLCSIEWEPYLLLAVYILIPKFNSMTTSSIKPINNICYI